MKVKKLLSVLLATVLLLTCIPLGAVSVSAATNITINGVDIGYANGSYFTKDGKVCSSCHSNSSISCVNSPSACNCMRYWPTGKASTCQVDLLAVQCFGYARYCQWKVYGYHEKSNASYFSDITGSISSGNCTASTLKSKLLGCAPATHLRTKSTVKGYGHSISIINTSDYGVDFTDCNSDGKCKVRLKTYSWSELATYIKGYGGVDYSSAWNRSVTPQLTIKYNANGGTITSNITSYTYKVTTSAGLNMRKSAGTGYAVVTSLPTNATFTVKVGETKTANGYTWGKTTYNGYTGWVVISDYVSKTATNRDSTYYLSSSLIYKSSTSKVHTQVMTYGKTATNGLYNAATFALTRSGYSFVGWCTKANGSTTIFDQNDTSVKPEQIYTNLKNGSATVTLYAIWECNHSYSNTCDTTCNTCGATRTITHSYTAATCTKPKTCKVCSVTSGSALGHTYTNACDTTCNTCGTTRTVSGHTYTNACDTTCNVCSATRTITHSYTAATCTVPKTCKVCSATSGSALGHTYTNACDTTCNTCGATRTVSGHTYTNACDTTCNVCGVTRTVSSHVYDNACDANCNICGLYRQIAGHVYDNGNDEECNICGLHRDACNHQYDHACDTTCNVVGCGYVRVTSHVYTNACDTLCNVCGATRTVSGHTYTNACDTSCNTCGAIRSITHSYAAATCTKPKTCKVCSATNGSALGHTYTNACDTTCNTCGTTRTVSGHTYTNACDTSCNNCGTIRSITHNYTVATCTLPATCTICGVTDGAALGHNYDNACDNTCNACGTVRNTDHVYEHACDPDCNVCGETRSTQHVYTDDCDRECNHCNATRTAPHVYSNVCDDECNACGFFRKVTHDYAAATCTKAKTCKVCGATSGSKLGHSYSKVVTKATTTKNGTIKNVCTRCNYTASKVTTIYKASKITLSATSYTYNGSVKKPTVTVKDSKGNTISKSNYTVTYASGRKNVGTYKVTVKMKGNYTGTKTLTFKINPAKTTVSKLTAGTKKLTVAITKKTTQVTGYQIQYSTSKSFKSYKTKTLTSYKTTSATLTGLKAKTTYYVRVRTYKTVNGVKYYSGWSTIKYKKTK